MFCNKCGKQLPDNATFCSGCGNKVGTAPAAAASAAPASLPPILSRLITQLKNFFTKKDPIGVVAHSAKDNSFSGIILAVFGMLMFALGAMVNVNQGLKAYVKAEAEGTYELYAKEVTKSFPSGTSFGMMLLTAFVVYVVAVLAIYFVVNNLAKKQLSISGACNIVAYASIPIIAVSILNMIFGLIWFFLPVAFMLLTVLATLIILIVSVNKVTDGEKPLTVNSVIFGVVAIVALVMIWVALKSIYDSADEKYFNAIYYNILNWFRD